MMRAAFIVLFLFVSHCVNADVALNPADLAKTSLYSEAKLSPDGKKLAVGVMVEGVRKLVIFDVNTFKNIGGVSLGDRNEVGNYYWATNERLVMEMLVRRPWKEEPEDYGELFAVDYDGGRPEIIYGARAGRDEMQTGSLTKKTVAEYGWGDIIHVLPDDPDHILISSTPMSEDHSNLPRVHRLNIYNGRMSRKITTAPIQDAAFITDRAGELKMATGEDENNQQRTYRYTGDTWEEVSADFGSRFSPLALNDDETRLYFLDNKDSDKLGLYTLDLTSGERKEIYTDKNVDISGINFTPDKSSVYALRVDDGYPSYMMFNDSGKEAGLFKALLSTFEGYRVSLTSSSDDGDKWIVYVSNDIDAGSFYLFDSKKQHLTQLFANLQHLDINLMAESVPVSFEARDGMMIHGYITYPVDMTETDKVPLVTLVHGGPHGQRDYWLFDREVQLLASQGYAVLRVNYRGSAGYGDNYQRAGYQHWGDTMQFDVIDGTRWAAAQPNIDADKVCIMGGSYGGYASVMSATLAPDLYKCVIANVGVYDLALMKRLGDIPDMLYGPAYLNKVLGDDDERLNAFSPVNRVSSLKAPVLIAHGKQDRRVPFEQAQRLEQALQAADKRYETFYKETESHGFRDEANRAAYYDRVASFLSAHLK
ncbi:S9 family peptidase [Alteromonas sp. CYL-A6]|uniref:S9 family peptidase n=1 Tax=Alteromonas nitratireducens TaxID=3390813 RepID=UPI0034B6B235